MKVLTRAFRGQLCKGKQSKSDEEKEKDIAMLSIFSKACNWKCVLLLQEMTILGACLTKCSEAGAVFMTLHFLHTLRMGQKARLLCYTKFKRLCSEKH